MADALPPLDLEKLPRAHIAREIARRFTFLRRLGTVELNRILAPLGATAPMYAILLRLSTEGQLSQQELALDAGLDAAGVSRLVAKLADMKLVTIKVDAQDRRRRLVRLTPKGTAFEQALEPVVDAAIRHTVIGLEEHEEYEFLRILDKTVRSMIEVLNLVKRDRRRSRARQVSPLLQLGGNDDADDDADDDAPTA
ncbi:MAG: winged helix DNA-binding protein [Deltaproteobacteria bacterium]|nr:winged helix DNA-binding protein [Deltaproteobacteria bacterium]